MKNLRSFSLLLGLSLLASCGYRWQPEQVTRPTVTVPYVVGDEEGLLTAEIIQALSQSGLVDVIHRGGDYRLQISIVGSGNETTGFRRDLQKVDGKVRNNLLAVEGRRNLSVEAALYQGDQIAYGPYLLTASADYDYVDGDSVQDLTFTNPEGELVTVLPFSLGQLESTESAQEAAAQPLYRRLAQKIVDTLSNHCF